MSAPDTLLLFDAGMLAHDTGYGHPENAGRLSALLESLAQDPPLGVHQAAPLEATDAQLSLVHAPELVAAVARSRGQPRTRFDADTVASADTHRAALLAAGAAVKATEAVVSGTAGGAFALVRPPGHHAEAARAMGFCFFNNAAVAAAHAITELGCRRVLLLDPDVHHGNGSQALFWDRPEVLYVSLHRFPFYPGTGDWDEVGGGRGEGKTLNLPLPAGLGDADYDALMAQVVEPVVDAFAPELIIVSAGFDTYFDDPLGGMRLTADGYRAMSARVWRWAQRHCPGRVAFVLEGGYHPTGVREGVLAALQAMRAPLPCAGEGTVRGPHAGIDPPDLGAMHPRLPGLLEHARRVHRAHWSALG
jgi:acetoin utilization deacetylase AcuC-like enzyme